jgi:hypothetical protein
LILAGIRDLPRLSSALGTLFSQLSLISSMPPQPGDFRRQPRDPGNPIALSRCGGL